MFVIRGTSKADRPQWQDKSVSIRTGQPSLKKTQESVFFLKKKNKSRMSPFHLARPSQRGCLLMKPGGPRDAGSDARQGMSEHGSPQQDIRVV